MIIDFHTHTFPDKISEKVVDKLGRFAHTKPFTNGSVSGLLSSMQEASQGEDTLAFSVNLPVMTSPQQVEKVNSSLIEQNEHLKEQGIITFGGMHPDYEPYRSQLQRLKENGIPGIKLHPAYQAVDLDDIRMLRIIDCASELGLITLIHAGIDIGINEHNYSSVSQILALLDQVHPEKLVLAHMGNWGCWDEVEQDLAGAPVWFDTAFSIGAITPYPGQEALLYRNANLSDEDFIRLVRKHGTDKILFGSDSPWDSQSAYIRQVNEMALRDDEKAQILSDNARALLKL